MSYKIKTHDLKDLLSKIFVLFFAFVFDTPASRLIPVDLFILPRLLLLLVLIGLICFEISRKHAKLGNTNHNIFYFVCFVLYYYLFSAIVHGVTFEIKVVISYVALTMLCLYWYNKNEHILYNALSSYFYIILLIQVLLQILSPTGINRTDAEYWIFDNRNYPIRFFLPGACFITLSSLNNKGKIFTLKTIIYLTLMAYVIFPSGSGTGIVTFICFVIFVLFFSKREYRLLSIKWMMIFTSAIIVLIVFFNTQNRFGFIFTSLNKDMTFSGRTIAWARALLLIKEHPLFGIGTYKSLSQFVLFSHCHQYWLQQLVTGGIVGTSIIIMMYLYADKTLRQVSSVKSRVFQICIICFLIAGIDEALTQSLFLYPLLVLSSEYGLNNYAN